MMAPSMSPTMRAAAALRQAGRLPALVALGSVSLGCAVLLSDPAGDRPLTTAEQAVRDAAFRQAGTITLPAVPPDASTGRWPAEHFHDQVWLVLWDDCDEDGDIVFVSSDGLGFSVPLTRQPVRLAVSRPTDGLLRLQGLFDGGGGITVALATAYGPVPLPVMAPGQTVAVPVR